MLNKKLAIVVSVLVFILSGLVTYYILSKGSQMKFLSPLSNYTPQKPNGNGTNEQVVPSEPRTEEDRKSVV